MHRFKHVGYQWLLFPTELNRLKRHRATLQGKVEKVSTSCKSLTQSRWQPGSDYHTIMIIFKSSRRHRTGRTDLQNGRFKYRWDCNEDTFEIQSIRPHSEVSWDAWGHILFRSGNILENTLMEHLPSCDGFITKQRYFYTSQCFS